MSNPTSDDYKTYLVQIGGIADSEMTTERILSWIDLCGRFTCWIACKEVAACNRWKFATT